MDKLALKEYLLDFEIASFESAKERFGMVNPSLPFDIFQLEDELKRIDTGSHSDLNNIGDLRLMLMHRTNVKLLHKYSFEDHVEIKPGSVTLINDTLYVIAIDKDPFLFEGQLMTGIDEKNELFQIIKDKKKGATCLQYGKLYNVKEVR